MIAFLSILAAMLTFIVAAAGKAALLTWCSGGGIGTFIVLFIIFKMMGK
jgi:hypothetical protein